MDSVDLLLPVLGVTCLGIFASWVLAMANDSLSETFASLKIGIVACGALLASPVFFYMTYHQFGAKTRLEAERLPPCNALGHAQRAQGGRAPRYIWRFEALDDSQKILRYYKDACYKAGWKVDSKSDGLYLSRDGTRIVVWREINGSEEQIVFQKNPPERK